MPRKFGNKRHSHQQIRKSASMYTAPGSFVSIQHWFGLVVDLLHYKTF